VLVCYHGNQTLTILAALIFAVQGRAVAGHLLGGENG
jgi:hypothetical protein